IDVACAIAVDVCSDTAAALVGGHRTTLVGGTTRHLTRTAIRSAGDVFGGEKVEGVVGTNRHRHDGAIGPHAVDRRHDRNGVALRVHGTRHKADGGGENRC